MHLTILRIQDLGKMIFYFCPGSKWPSAGQHTFFDYTNENYVSERKMKV